MCMTSRPAQLARTKLYAGEAELEGKYVHVLAYQNKATTRGPNAMLLPIPAAVTPTAANVVDTRRFPTFLDEIHMATQLHSMREARSMSRAMVPKVQVFHVGSYTVVLAERPRLVAQALGSVPENKRPEVGNRILDAISEQYPGWPLAVCCWDGTIEAEPLLWWYEPRMPRWLFAPALDAHDGEPPDPSAEVRVDHHIAFGSTLDPFGDPVPYSDAVPEGWHALLPSRVRGTRLRGTMPNGDFWRSTKTYSGPALRCAPPGREAPQGFLAGVAGWLRESPPAAPKAEIALDGWR